ncbi:hypothetical protein BH10PSE13_BH10PSE13_23170 [soil metagenome]
MAVIGLVADRWSASPPVTAPRYSYGPRSFGDALASAHDDVLAGADRVKRAPGDWINQEIHARGLMGRARLTGSFDDLAAARAALDRGMRDATPPSGPVLLDAVNLMMLHRHSSVQRDLDMFEGQAVPPGPDDRAESTAIRGDVAFYSGHYARAMEANRAAEKLDDGPGAQMRIANWDRKMGRFDAALARLDRTLAGPRPPTRQFTATVLLQKGLTELGRGRWDEAAALFDEAEATFPGHWLTAAYRAQMIAAKGDLAGAARAYAAILQRSTVAMPMPEVMDALAALLRARGDVKGSRWWAARAGAIWNRRIAQLPEAAVGHALEHELALGTPARALALARANWRARPYGDSAVLLGLALRANGDPASAARLMQALERTGWRGAPQYVVLSEALAMLGRSEESDAARAEAIAINPRAFDPSASLLWFGNH